MIYVALLEGAAIIIIAAFYGTTIRSLVRQQARERDLMLNQLYNAIGRPWQPAPASEVVAEEPVSAYTVSPDEYDWEDLQGIES